jgi:hypothetical protein
LDITDSTNQCLYATEPEPDSDYDEPDPESYYDGYVPIDYYEHAHEHDEPDVQAPTVTTASPARLFAKRTFVPHRLEKPFQRLADVFGAGFEHYTYACIPLDALGLVAKDLGLGVADMPYIIALLTSYRADSQTTVTVANECIARRVWSDRRNVGRGLKRLGGLKLIKLIHEGGGYERGNTWDLSPLLKALGEGLAKLQPGWEKADRKRGKSSSTGKPAPQAQGKGLAEGEAATATAEVFSIEQLPERGSISVKNLSASKSKGPSAKMVSSIRRFMMESWKTFAEDVVKATGTGKCYQELNDEAIPIFWEQVPRPPHGKKPWDMFDRRYLDFAFKKLVAKYGQKSAPSNPQKSVVVAPVSQEAADDDEDDD